MTSRASEMTIAQIEDVLLGMDWTEIHRARVFGDYGDSVVLYTDGKFRVQDQGMYHPSPDSAGVIGYLPCWGIGNIDRTDYFEGWVERVRDGVEDGSAREWITWDDENAIYRHTKTGEEVSGDDVVEFVTGRMLSETEALEEAIEDGEWNYDDDIDGVLNRVMEERDQRAAISGE